MAKSNPAAGKTTNKTPAKTDAEKRAALREKIAAGEERQAQRSLADQAKDAADSALGYVRANPLKTVAAVAVGAPVIGAMTRPGRRAGRKAGAFAGVATDAALAYGLSLLDNVATAAGRGQEKLGDLGSAAGDKASAWKSAAAREGNQLSDYVVQAASRSRKRAGRTIDDLRSRLRH